LRGEFALGLEHVQQAINDAYDQGALGKNIFGSGFSIDIVLQPGAGAYICGEETALIEALEGKRGFPRIKPPFFPAAIGLYGAPTVVNNVETMSNLPWIVLNGGAAFAALGGGRSTGTRLFALSGRVNNPNMFELEMVKNTFRDLIYDPRLGNGIIDGKQLKAFIPHGFDPIFWISHWDKTKWEKRVQCSDPVPLLFLMKRRVLFGPRGGLRSFSRANRVVNAHRVVKVLDGWSE
jgi:NADH-quinone oxidoreductase subunit F